MTPQYLDNLRIVWAQPLWYTIGWGFVAIVCLYAAYLPLRYMFKHNDHDPLTGTAVCAVSGSLGALAVAPLLMVAFKVHAYILFG